jgi:DNA-binding transcriptional MerR regulator
MNEIERTYSFKEICNLAALPERTVRFYIQKGLVPTPHGKKRGAWYDELHLERLLTIRRWQRAGLSLERIAEIIAGGEVDIPEPPRSKPGSVEVWSHLLVMDGVELHIEPHRAGLSPEQLRAFCREVTKLLDNTTKGKEESDHENRNS